MMVVAMIDLIDCVCVVCVCGCSLDDVLKCLN